MSGVIAVGLCSACGGLLIGRRRCRLEPFSRESRGKRKGAGDEHRKHTQNSSQGELPCGAFGHGYQTALGAVATGIRFLWWGDLCDNVTQCRPRNDGFSLHLAPNACPNGILKFSKERPRMALILPNAAHEESYGRLWQFGECEFDELRYELRVRNTVVDLEGKPLEVLHQLLLNAGDTVRKDDLLASVWPGVLVVDASLATAVSKLRKVLGDEEIIKTVSKVGYRISVPVRPPITHPPLIGPTPNTKKAPYGANSSRPEVLAIEVTGPRGLLKRSLTTLIVASVLLAGLAVGLDTFRRGLKANLIPGPITIIPFHNSASNHRFDYHTPPTPA